MSDSTKKVEYEITADAGGFVKSMEQASLAVTTASAQIDTQFKKIGDTVSKLQTFMLGFTAVLAGGGALKKFISDANEWNGEAGKMAKQLGITTEAASILNVALKHIGVDSDTYVSASEKLSKNIQGNAQAFQVLGIKVQEASGQYRPVTQVMAEVNEKLAALKNPIEQNIAGQQVYGKGWSEIRGILKLTATSMDEAEIRARELGLIVGPEGAAMSRKYTEQMRDLNLVGKAIEVQFGNALLPLFTRMGAVMSKELPTAAGAFSMALGTVVETVLILGANLEFVLSAIGREIAAVAAQAALLFDPSSWGSGRFTAISDAVKEDGVRARKELDELEKKILGISKPEAATPGKAAPTAESPHYKFKEKQEGDGPSEMTRWEAELAERKLMIAERARAEGTFREMSKQEEQAYWQSILSTIDRSSHDGLSVRKKVAEEGAAIDKQTFDTRMETLRVEKEELQKNYAARIAIATTAYTETAAKYGQESKEAQKAYGEILGERRKLVDQQRALDSAAAEAHRAKMANDIEIERVDTQMRLELGSITNEQALEQDRVYEERLYAIKLQAMQERLALVNQENDPEAAAQLHAQIEAAEEQHQLRMKQIKASLTVTSMTPLVNTFKAAEQSISTAIQGIVNRTMTLRQAMASIWKGISQSIITEIANIMAKKVAAWATEKALTMMGIGAKAADAGAGAASSMASIPYVGPVLAIAAMAAVFAGVMGMQSNVPSASAAGGFDIPGNVNPVTQLHAREMVLPAKHADVIRAIADGGILSQASAQPPVMINATGGDFIHKTDLAKLLKQMNRDFVFVGARR